MKSFKLIFYLILALTSCTRQQEKQITRRYGNTLHFAYVVLYDQQTPVNTDLTNQINDRLDAFTKIMHREALERLTVKCTPLFINSSSLGLHQLNYADHTFFEWMDCLLEADALKTDFDVIAFTPIRAMPWASDSHSIGFFYKNCVCFSLEYYPHSEKDNVQAIALMIHKMFHGFGYNHQNINMPALKLLNWELGLPVNTGLEYTLRNREGYQSFFFNPHILNVLDPNASDSLCPDSRGLISQSCPWRKGMTVDAYGPACTDADHDGIMDEQDDYFLSSPIRGRDTDDDGIVDALDLVPWNQIRVTGNIDARKINLIGKVDQSTLEFSSDHVNITEIKTIWLKSVPVQLKPDHFPGCFPGQDAVSTKGNRIVLDKDLHKPPIVRIEVHYAYENQAFYRPYYFYFPGTMVLQIINEREWYYFLRYGADIPAGIDFYTVDSYDGNFDGILDQTNWLYFEIPEAYDWDGDGFPDWKDALPTVYGKFYNEFVVGVKDSDQDGLADPGVLDFSPPGTSISSEYYFGELQRIIGKNPDFDRSPYLKGNEQTKDFPKQHF